MEQLKIVKAKAPVSTGWKPVTVKASIVDSLKELSIETGLPISTLATKMIEFATNNMIIVDED